MAKGTVKWFDAKKGYGFIEMQDGKDIFVHHSEIQNNRNGFRTLEDGQQVDFEIKKGLKGEQASQVTVIG
jgi:CspA family cold shock protein